MNDKEFLNWIIDRLINVYNENPNVDFIHRLRKIADKLEIIADAVTPWGQPWCVECFYNRLMTITKSGEKIMTNELKDRIKNFIVSWDNTIDDETMGLADYDLRNIKPKY
jgi:hypothetical protein